MPQFSITSDARASVDVGMAGEGNEAGADPSDRLEQPEELLRFSAV